ncbi:MAG: hypothetical protein J5654_12945 [Victivallales bacterium]|nr:hypothetical protein [Victivallales bacterium]
MISDEQIKQALVKAVISFYQKESRLVDDGVCERAIVGRILLYLAQKIKRLRYGYEVFTEFNRMYEGVDNHAMVKLLDSENGKKIKVYPDILVLKCNNDMTPCENILVVEAKKFDNASFSALKSDKTKLKIFTEVFSETISFQRCFGYQIGAHLFFDMNRFVILWYKNGEPTEEVIFTKNGNHFDHETRDFVYSNYYYDKRQHELKLN